MVGNREKQGMNGLLRFHDWTFPVPIAYGPGRLSEVAHSCKFHGMKRPLIATDRGSADLPFIKETLEHLRVGGLQFGVYYDISPNPLDEEIVAGCAIFRENKHDSVIAIGGGSGMDGGKAICLSATNNIDLWRFNYDLQPPDILAESFPPLICIPTTAGTGAETASTSMITDTERLMKICIWHPELKPRLALLDPAITLGLPQKLTAWTGCDAMIHAIEAYCVPDFHPLCDGLAIEGLRLIGTWLPEAINNGRNVEARGAMLIGSCLAGISFLKGLGLVHAISHMVGAEYDTHHGLTNAIVLPSVLRFNAPSISDKARVMASTMGLEDKSFDSFYASICERLDNSHIPKKLTDIGVPDNCATMIAEKAMQDTAAGTNPRPLTHRDVTEVIDLALKEGR